MHLWSLVKFANKEWRLCCQDIPQHACITQSTIPDWLLIYSSFDQLDVPELESRMVEWSLGLIEGSSDSEVKYIAIVRTLKRYNCEERRQSTNQPKVDLVPHLCGQHYGEVIFLLVSVQAGTY